MKKRLATTLLLPGSILLAGTAFADTEEKGWHSSLGLITGYITGEGQLDAYGGKKRIESLNEKPARYHYYFLFPDTQLSYTFENSVTIYSNGGMLDGGGVGVSYLFADDTRLSISVPLLLGTGGKVWQDPYLTGKNRKRTDAELEAAVDFSIENIRGSFVSVDYSYQDLSIKKDRIGDSLNTRLSPIEIKQLRRGRKSHRVAVSLPPLTLSDRLYLTGGASSTRANAEGKANSFIAYSIELTIAYEKDGVEIFGQISDGAARYRLVNPVFGARRKDDLRIISAGITYGKPFNWKHSSLEENGR